MHKFILRMKRLICAMKAANKHASSPRGAGGGEPSPAEVEEVTKRTGAKQVLSTTEVGIYASCTFGWYGRHKHYRIVDERGENFLYCERSGIMHYLPPALVNAEGV